MQENTERASSQAALVKTRSSPTSRVPKGSRADIRRKSHRRALLVFSCLCGTQRTYGFAPSADVAFNARPLLACVSCGTVTQHVFLRCGQRWNGKSR